MSERVGRHYCKTCKCWTQGDPESIRRHERANRHKYRLLSLSRKSRREREKVERERKQLERTMRKVERQSGIRLGDQIERPSVYKPKSFKNKNGDDENQAGVATFDQHEEDFEEDEEEIDENEVLGQYFMDDTLYLQGNWHEDLLVPGTMCEALIFRNSANEVGGDDEEDVADWEAVTIEKVTLRSIKETKTSVTVITRVYHVTSLQTATGVNSVAVNSGTRDSNDEGDMFASDSNPEDDSKSEQDHEQKDKTAAEEKESATQPDNLSIVAARNIRLKAPRPPSQPPTIEELQQIEKHKMGLSAWTTVAVRTVTENDGEQAVVKTEDGVAVKMEDENLEGNEKETEDDEPQGDAYATFNPFGGNYKGFQISATEEKRVDVHENIDAGDILNNIPQQTNRVAKFKKRKKKKPQT
uniref:Matrin-type domain-containing protein n=1 Tax=Aplanochytrium stocchinoi TaxID=215587 RepID=A0A7S3LSU4_9STRA